MTAREISSTKNPLVKRIREIRDGRVDGLIVAEGVRLIEEALDAGLLAVQSLVSPRLYSSERGTQLASKLAQASRESLDCTDRVLERASSLGSHQGVLAVFQRPSWSETELLSGAPPFRLIPARRPRPAGMQAAAPVAHLVVHVARSVHRRLLSLPIPGLQPPLDSSLASLQDLPSNLSHSKCPPSCWRQISQPDFDTNV